MVSAHNNNNKWIRLVALCGLLIAGKTLANGADLTIYTEEFPPYNFSRGDKVVGINVDIVRTLCEKARLTCKFQILPWKRAYTFALETPDSGLVSTSRNKAREKFFHWIGPLVSSKSHFYRLKKRHDIKIGNQRDLLQYTIGIPRSDVYHAVLTDFGFKPGVNLLMFSQKHQDMKVFFSGKLDLILGSELTLPYQMQSIGYDIADVVPVFTIVHPDVQGNYLALNKQTSPKIVRALQQVVDQLKEEAGLDPFIQRYRRPHPID